ncbi:hypothetical protein AC579_6634 [Pseudocercospora musae]|uniref:Tyrosinase copper-binding domain-containing protein n=1 Tax=Pseudocercospora musae TaxID=113226 RepID=A0A139I098_9PEZI|nr:hypothetical protein AC579_6634 [Pseudocercospora musae]
MQPTTISPSSQLKHMPGTSMTSMFGSQKDTQEDRVPARLVTSAFVDSGDHVQVDNEGTLSKPSDAFSRTSAGTRSFVGRMWVQRRKVSSGGGCVTAGPFNDMTVNLGHASLDLPGGVIEMASSRNLLDADPRSLNWDSVDAMSRRYANALSVLSQITQSKNVYNFRTQMQGVPGSEDIGTPKPYERQFTVDAIAGTRTLLNTPPSANETLEDLVDFGFAAGPARPIGNLLSRARGPFCNVYL